MHWVNYYHAEVVAVADDEMQLRGVGFQKVGWRRGYLSAKGKKGDAPVQRALAPLHITLCESFRFDASIFKHYCLLGTTTFCGKTCHKHSSLDNQTQQKGGLHT